MLSYLYKKVRRCSESTENGICGKYAEYNDYGKLYCNDHRPFISKYIPFEAHVNDKKMFNYKTPVKSNDNDKVYDIDSSILDEVTNEYSGHICYCCKQQIMSKRHDVLYNPDGPWSLENIRPICQSCFFLRNEKYKDSMLTSLISEVRRCRSSGYGGLSTCGFYAEYVKNGGMFACNVHRGSNSKKIKSHPNDDKMFNYVPSQYDKIEHESESDSVSDSDSSDTHERIAIETLSKQIEDMSAEIKTLISLVNNQNSIIEDLRTKLDNVSNIAKQAIDLHIRTDCDICESDIRDTEACICGICSVAYKACSRCIDHGHNHCREKEDS